MREYQRAIGSALDEYQMSRGGGMVGACIIEPVRQVRGAPLCLRKP